MKNWKTPGKDKIHGYWIKNLTNLHERLAWQLQSVLEGNVPEWIVEGRTSLIRKNKNIDLKVVTNYRPITCLSTTWKRLTSIIANELYNHLAKKGLYQQIK